MKRPNILLFLPDGMQGRLVEPGHLCRTPHIDRIAAMGVRAHRAYSPSPTCSPARASLMTGLLPHRHGVLELEHYLDPDQSVLRDQFPHFAQRLRAAGYRTGYFGKWHIERSNDLRRYGWDVDGGWRSPSFRRYVEERRVDEEPAIDPLLSYYNPGPDGYETHLHYGVTDVPMERRTVGVPASLALEFLDDAAASAQPWCCAVSFIEPNEKMICGRAAFEQYDLKAITLPATLDDRMDGRPNIYRRQQQVWADLTEKEWREARACYYGLASEVDSQIGRILDLLEARGELDNTVIVVTSDHGRYLGSHGLDGHNFGAFEEIYHVPLIVAGPGLPRGVCTQARIGIHDLPATLCQLTGTPWPTYPESRSCVEVLRDPRRVPDDWRQGYAEYHGTRFRLTQRVAWKDQWKFVFNGFDFDELYDLDNDPHETRNLIDNPRYAEQVHAMMSYVWRMIRDTNDRPLWTSHYYSLRFASIGPNVANV